MASERKKILLRLDPAVHDALARWAADELRSTNAQIEFLLRQALSDAGRMPRTAGRMRRPGRPRKTRSADGDGSIEQTTDQTASDETAARTASARTGPGGTGPDRTGEKDQTGPGEGSSPGNPYGEESSARPSADPSSGPQAGGERTNEHED